MLDKCWTRSRPCGHPRCAHPHRCPCRAFLRRWQAAGAVLPTRPRLPRMSPTDGSMDQLARAERRCSLRWSHSYARSPRWPMRYCANIRVWDTCVPTGGVQLSAAGSVGRFGAAARMSAELGQPSEPRVALCSDEAHSATFGRAGGVRVSACVGVVWRVDGVREGFCACREVRNSKRGRCMATTSCLQSLVESRCLNLWLGLERA
jgi:hypothetical protein